MLLYATICEWISTCLYVYEYGYVISLWLLMWYIYIYMLIYGYWSQERHWIIEKYCYMWKYLQWQSMKYSDVLEMHWYMIILPILQGFKRKVIGSLPKYPPYVFKYGTWPTCGLQERLVVITSGIHAPGTWPTRGLQARPVVVTSGIHDPIYMLPAILGS